MLTFEHSIVLSTRDGTMQEMIGNEPNNSLYKYYLDRSSRASDQAANVEYANYSDLVWGNVIKSLTSQKVRRIGIKTFPQVGAIGFFTLLDEERSKILAPVHTATKKYAAPDFTIEETDTSLIFHCVSPKDINYACYRIILRLDMFALEYITYEETLEVSRPVTTGIYDIYCVGYIHEGEAVSEDSVHYQKQIVGTQDTWPGPQENSDIFVKDIQLTKDNRVKVLRSDGVNKSTDSTIPIPVAATFLPDGKLQITLSNDVVITTDNTAPSSGGGGGGGVPSNNAVGASYEIPFEASPATLTNITIIEEAT